MNGASNSMGQASELSSSL